MITAKHIKHLNFKNEIYICIHTHTHIKMGFQFLLRQVRKDNGQLQRDRSLQEHTACEHLLAWSRQFHTLEFSKTS